MLGIYRCACTYFYDKIITSVVRRNNVNYRNVYIENGILMIERLIPLYRALEERMACIILYMSNHGINWLKKKYTNKTSSTWNVFLLQ